MKTLIKTVLILGIDETFRKDMTNGGLEVSQTDIAIEKETKGALRSAFSKRPELLIIEWDVFVVSDLTKFLQKVRKLAGCENLPILFVVQQLATQPVAIAAEYDIMKVIPRAAFAARFSEVFQEISAEMQAPGIFRAKLEAVTKASKLSSTEKLGKAVEQLYRQFPDQIKAQLEFANYSIRVGNYEKGNEIAQRILVKWPDNLRALNIIARVKFHQHNFSDAMSMLEQAEILSPKNLERLVLLGDLYLEQGKTDEAKKQYGQALEINATEKQAQKGMGIIDLSEGQLSAAMSLFRDALSSEEVAGFFNAAGILAVRRNRFEQATTLYDAAIHVLSSSREKARVYFNMGLAYEHWKKTEKAKNCFQQALDLDPTFEKNRKRLNSFGPVAPRIPSPEGFVDDEAVVPLAPETFTSSLILQKVAEFFPDESKQMGPFHVEVIEDED